MEPEEELLHSSSKEEDWQGGWCEAGKKAEQLQGGVVPADQSQAGKYGWLFGCMGHLWGGHMEPQHERTVHQRQKGQAAYLLVPLSFLSGVKTCPTGCYKSATLPTCNIEPFQSPRKEAWTSTDPATWGGWWEWRAQVVRLRATSFKMLILLHLLGKYIFTYNIWLSTYNTIYYMMIIIDA